MQTFDQIDVYKGCRSFHPVAELMAFQQSFPDSQPAKEQRYANSGHTGYDWN